MGPIGVPPSPSRLLAVMPPRPSAHENTRPSAINRPCVGLPGRGRTVMRLMKPCFCLDTCIGTHHHRTHRRDRPIADGEVQHIAKIVKLLI